VKYVVEVADREGELLPKDRERSVPARAVPTSSPNSLAPAARSCSGVSHSRLGAHARGAPSGSKLCSPCSVTGASTSFAAWLLLRLRGGALVGSTLLPLLPPLPGRADADPGAWCDGVERGWPRARRASRTISPSSEGMRGRWMLLLRLDCALALARLPLAASLNETIVARVGGREDVEEDGAIEGAPTPPPQALTSMVERRLASSREPTDSIVGIRLMTPPSIPTGSSVWTSRPNSSMDM